MGIDVEECEICGAPTEPGADGRTYACPYCRAQRLVTVDAAQISAGMKLDLANAAAFLDRLAHTLEAAFADRTKIQRHGAAVQVIELDLGAERFVATREAHGVLAQHKKVVRGIALKTVSHPLDRWVELLTAALAAHANENTRASEALSALFAARR